MCSKKSVLCFGKDRSLLNSRTWLLDKLFVTTAVMNVAEMESLAAEGRCFDLIVLCHTVPLNECEMASAFARQCWPNAKILGLTAIHASCVPPVTDATMAGLDGPAMLLKRAAEMLQLG